jgi:hypothetical protein
MCRENGWTASWQAQEIADYLVFVSERYGFQSVRHAVLARRIGCSAKTVQRWITRFEDAGFLAVVRARRNQQADGTWNQAPNTYQWCSVRRTRGQAAGARHLRRRERRALLGSKARSSTTPVLPAGHDREGHPTSKDVQADPVVVEPVDGIEISDAKPDLTRVREIVRASREAGRMESRLAAT